ncbi:sugar ABC transporter ATP-binding protein [Dickeya chrysanthemi]|uniref:sugar ABC transporter ATP-binding protein n=1 Tax=Dickeya chrysanthemi TaxID=556 RepID=UPI000532B33D|nr:sugar ABC transporter ATP-binding protein [Dickeya chrysanthemi]
MADMSIPMRAAIMPTAPAVTTTSPTTQAETAPEVIIETRDLSRVYPGVTALDQVNYRVYRNQVNVLIGENGAGKSTMMKMLAGVETPSSGQILLDGKPVTLGSTQQAERQGISIIFQELNLFPNMNVMDNIFIANEFFQRGVINEKFQYALAKTLLERLELDVDPYTPLGELGIGHQQLVEIARALSKDTRVLIMDEPTSALSQSEVKVLFGVIEQLKRRGVTIIYISHRLEELMEIGDHITIFRDGRFICEREVRHASVPWIIEQMVGDKKKHFDYQPAPQGDTVLTVSGLTALHQSGGYRLNDVSFSLRKGEVVGIYGLLGAGRTELFKGLIGLMPCQQGSVQLNDDCLDGLGFRQRLEKGIALVPEDRQGEGMVQLMSIRANMTLSSLSLRGFWRAWTWLREPDEARQVDEMVRQLAIKVSDDELPITSLSGGNQQKVVLGKALMTRPQVVLLDEPTRGIDVGAKTDVYHLIGRMAQQGLSVMFSSSELDEVMALADRILVMADGRITADLPRSQVTREILISASTPHD